MGARLTVVPMTVVGGSSTTETLQGLTGYLHQLAFDVGTCGDTDIDITLKTPGGDVTILSVDEVAADTVYLPRTGMCTSAGASILQYNLGPAIPERPLVDGCGLEIQLAAAGEDTFSMVAYVWTVDEG